MTHLLKRYAERPVNKALYGHLDLRALQAIATSQSDAWRRKLRRTIKGLHLPTRLRKAWLAEIRTQPQPCPPNRSRFKFRLLPGPVTSRTDGERHHITAANLADLYQVPMALCLVGPPRPGDPQGLLELRPRYDGRYTCPLHPEPVVQEPPKPPRKPCCPICGTPLSQWCACGYGPEHFGP